MKIDRIRVGKSVEALGLWHKLDIEGVIGETENPETAHAELKAMLDKLLPTIDRNTFGYDGWTAPPQKAIVTSASTEEKIPYDSQVEGMLELIKMCNTRPLLERQRFQVERLNSMKVNEAFNNKLKSFE